MHLLLTEIQWDDEGMGYEECNLPNTVVALDAPENVTEDYINNEVSEALSDCFGFCHHGFQWERLSKVHDTHAGGGFFPARLATMLAPESSEDD